MAGLFSTGWSELKRRRERRALTKVLAAHEQTLANLYARLGDGALSAGTDLSDYAALRAQIERLEGRKSELASVSAGLETKRAEIEQRRAQENARFDGYRSVIESKKQPVEAELATARGRHQQKRAEVTAAQSRLAALEQQLQQWRAAQASITDGPAAPQAQLAALEAEQRQVAEQLHAAIAAAAPEEQAVADAGARVQGFDVELQRIEGERAEAMRTLDTEVRRLESELSDTGERARVASLERWARCAELGRALYAAGLGSQLEAEEAAVREEESRKAATQSAITASEQLSSTIPANTVPKFLAASLASVLAVVAVPLGGYAAWTWWNERQEEQRAEREYAAQRERPPVNPYLDHRLNQEPPYRLANEFTDAKTQKEAEAALLKLCRALGLGVYTHEGRKIQGGAERSDKDFFLYDFQLRTLARTQQRPSFITLYDFSRVIGEGLLGLDPPEMTIGLLGPGLASRYEEAERDPKAPENFIVLFIDGLARRQPAPYDLSNARSGNAQDLQVSPVMSLLMVMEFFMPRKPARTSWIPAFDLVPSAHAQAPCEILGEEAQNNFGKGADILTGILEKLPNKIGDIAGAIGEVTGAIGFAGDMMTLYGVDILLQPQPYTIHLLHDEPFVAAIAGSVTFDAEVPNEVLKCGWMAGKKMPVKGPVPGVILNWEFSPTLNPRLMMNSATQLTGHLGLETKTDETGTSMFLIDPAPCPDKQGRVVGQDYMATASARMITADTPTPSFSLGHGVILKLLPGTIEYFMRGRKGYTRFRAEWHTKKPDKPQYPYQDEER